MPYYTKHHNRIRSIMVTTAIATTMHPLQPNSEYFPPKSYSVELIFFRASVPLSRYSPNPSLVYSKLRDAGTLLVEGAVDAHCDVLELRDLVLHVVDQSLPLFVAELPAHMLVMCNIIEQSVC